MRRRPSERRRSALSRPRRMPSENCRRRRSGLRRRDSSRLRIKKEFYGKRKRNKNVWQRSKTSSERGSVKRRSDRLNLSRKRRRRKKSDYKKNSSRKLKKRKKLQGR